MIGGLKFAIRASTSISKSKVKESSIGFRGQNPQSEVGGGVETVLWVVNDSENVGFERPSNSVLGLRVKKKHTMRKT